MIKQHLRVSASGIVHRSECRYALNSAEMPGTFEWRNGHPAHPAFWDGVAWGCRACKVCRPDEEPLSAVDLMEALKEPLSAVDFERKVKP